MRTIDRRAWVEQVMGMPISVHLRGGGLDDPEVERAVARVFTDLRRTEELFSVHRSDSQISAINRGTLDPQDRHPLVVEVIELCDQARDRTGGYFDALRTTEDGGTWFDPTGLVKGWAVERAAANLRALPGAEFCLNAGGDIVVGGREPWHIGIEDPTVAARVIATVFATDQAVASSGRAHRGDHIIVPRTGRVAVDLLAATVIGPSLTWADVYATAAVAMGEGGLAWLEGLPGYAGLVVKRSGTALVTSDWPVD